MSSRQQYSPAELPANELPSRRRALTAVAVLLLIGAAFVIYQPCFKGGLILDDDIYFTATGLLPAPNGLQRIWFSREQPEYYPINYTVLWLQWRLWGLNTAGYHVVNVLLHISVALLLWRLLQRLSIPGAYLAALLFTVHPVNVESVAWIFQIRGLLAMAFAILSILCYLNATPDDLSEQVNSSDVLPRHSFAPFKLAAWYCASLLIFLLAMLSKGSVAILPVVLLLIVWWRQRRITLADLARSAPYFLLSAGLTCVNLWFQTRGTGRGNPLRRFCRAFGRRRHSFVVLSIESAGAG